MNKAPTGVTIGKEFEGALSGALKPLLVRGLTITRLHDTAAAAGTFLSANPSDYLFTCRKFGNAFVEFKASATQKSFIRSLLSSKQRETAIRCKLADAPYHIFFYSKITGKVQVWDGMAGVDARSRSVSREWLLAEEHVGQIGSKEFVICLEHVIAGFYDLPSEVDHTRRLARFLEKF